MDNKEKIKLFDAIDFVDYVTIRDAFYSINTHSSLICKEFEDYNAKVKKVIDEYSSILDTSASELCVYDYVFFIFRTLFDKYHCWLENEAVEGEYFDSPSMLEDILSHYNGNEYSEHLKKYDVEEFFERVVSDPRFTTLFYNRYLLELQKPDPEDDPEEDDD